MTPEDLTLGHLPYACEVCGARYHGQEAAAGCCTGQAAAVEAGCNCSHLPDESRCIRCRRVEDRGRGVIACGGRLA